MLDTDDIYPLNYKVRLELSPENSSFQGTTTITINSKILTNTVLLNAEKLAIWNCGVRIENELVNCSYAFNPQSQELLVNLPKEMKDNIEVTIDYSGKFQEELLGLYRSKYEYSGKKNYVIASQFEEKYARRAIPCFDHPAKKATFDIELVIEEKLVGVSNTQIKEERNLKDGMKLVRFEPTPKMSAYLLFFGVGNFELIQDSSTDCLVRVITTPGKSQYGQLAMELAKKSILFCEEYTGIKYPISKCDLIGIPDFLHGAMENYGAISYREAILLIYPEITSKYFMMRFGAVTPHEVAHFWFGDLVSPRDWKDLWLNESFASYFTYAISNWCFPEWRIWNLFYERYYITALERDGLIETYPIELPAESIDVIGRAKVKILYDKGASVLLMFQAYLGEINFKKGISHFLNKYKFSNADSNQYWEAFQEATKFPVNKFAKSWVFQSGYPLVKVVRKGNELILTQEWFTYLPHDSETSWLIPLRISLYLNNGEKEELDVVFEEKTKVISIPPETRAFKINTGQKAFCRVMYEKSGLKELRLLIRDKELSSLDRFGVENDLYAFVLNGANKLEEYLEFLAENFEFEDEYVPLFSICHNLLHAYTVMDSKRSAIEDKGKLIFKRYFEKHGFQPKDNEEISISALRYKVLWTACSLGYQDAINFGIEEFQNLIEGKKVHQDILSSVLRIGAAFRNDALDYFLEKIISPDTPEIERYYINQAMGCFREKNQILNALDLILEKIPHQSQFIAFELLGKNAFAIEPLGEWLLNNLKKLEELPETAYEQAIEYLVPTGGLNKIFEIKQLLEERMKKTTIGSGTLKMALEKLEINSRLKNRN